MNALRLMSVLALLLTLLPWRAQAAEADDFVAASRSQQAQLLTQWAAAPQADRLPLLRALTTESLVMDDGKHAFRTRQGGLQPLGAVAAPQGETRPVRLTNRLRNLAAGALASHLILSDNVTERASAARTLQREATPAMAALLQQRLQAETDDNVRGLLEVALARLQLTQPEASARLAAVTLLGHSADPETQALLIPFTDAQHEPDAAVREAASDSLQKIKHRLLLGDLLGQAFMGLSLGSVLLLAALGLAITYGLLGVINMAHGEMLMIGAYSCWLVQQALAQLAPQWLAFYPLVALPVAFLVTAGIGMALERTIIRHLYGRPLETLLATWGISLMLIQLVRMLIGMGYGRFAFTGVLPLMLNEGLLTLHQGNLAASANYAGYLVGALLLARVQPGAASRLSIISAGLTIASLALLAWVSSPWTIIALRAVAGALSAITLIAGSLWLLEHMGHHHGAPLLYAGVGLGIFISAEGIALGHALSLTSQQIWLLCALCAGLLLALAIRWLLTPPAALVRVSHVETSLPEAGSDTRRAA